MEQANSLKTDIEYLKGVGPKKGEHLRKELDIHAFRDLLLYFPFRYVDRSKVHPIQAVFSNDSYIQIAGTLKNVREAGSKYKKRLTALLSDETGKVELIWFKGANWVQKYLQEGQQYIVFGKPNFFKGQVSIPHPELELMNDEQQKSGGLGIQPVYGTTEKLKAKGLDSRGIVKIQQNLIDNCIQEVTEILPQNLKDAFKLIGRQDAFKNIHFPEDFRTLEKAQYRLKFEELFFIQLKLIRHKAERQKLKGKVFETLGHYFNQFYHEVLPFELTGAQKRVLKEIRKDLKSGYQMNRLMQGDVGSGKTVVALMGMLMALDNGFQATMMAPTEILAIQHFNTLKTLLDGVDVEVRLLTGSSKAAERKEILNLLSTGKLQIIVGTHALLEDPVQFSNLGFVVIDEQHRFGVAQRARLWNKSKIPPHILVMTATPIPRTLAMTLYGDLDYSVIDELPPGRKPVKTRHVYENKRLQVFGFFRQMIQKGQQIYIVYPLIEESEKMDYQNLMEGYESICREFPLPDYKVSIVHGQMKPEDKDYEMERFKKGATQIMVATTVIEVGVDVPNATVMLIESAERFGLSQLHQLRGRVGRGGNQSYCILMTGYKCSEDAKKKMKAMTETNDGFKLSEVDMNLRGPGDISGTRQSGDLNFKIANLATDNKILQAARTAAQKITDEDPELQNPENSGIKRYFERLEKGKPNWSLIS